MKWSKSQKELFKKNLKALGNPSLKNKLEAVKKSSFKLIFGKENLDINLASAGGGGGDVSKRPS